jgi:FkbM family methyltransferase
VVHVGAHSAEEESDYEAFEFGPVYWVEAQPVLAQHLKARIRPPSKVFQALIWDVSGEEMSLKLTSNSQSSSVFEFGTHKIDHPDVKVVGEVMLKTVRLDDILPEDSLHNFLNIDIQGAEYQALKSLGNLIGKFDYVYLEVNRGQVYKGIKQVEDLDKLLGEGGFSRVATIWTQASWGDALYIRKNLAHALFGGALGLKIVTLLYKLLLGWRKSTLMRHVRHIFLSGKSN